METLCQELRSLEVDYVVLVGGMAVELAGYPTGTEDGDFAVTMREFRRVMRLLGDHPRFREVESLDTIGSAQFFTGTGWIDVGFLNPKLFRGRRSGDRFLQYVKRYRSVSTTLGPVARPEVAWYMRLVVPNWLIYVQKTLRDIRAGVPEETLEDVLAMARVLGVEDTIRPRVEKTRDVIAMASH